MDLDIKKQFNKDLFKIAIPFALQGLLNALVGASDALMLGRLTQEAIAAVSLANQISFVMTLFTSSFVSSAGVLIAQYYGKEDQLTVKRLMSMALRYTFLICVIFFLLSFFIPEQLMRLFTSEAELIAIGASYLRIVCFSYLFSGLTSCYLMMMKMDGREKISVRISVVKVIVDMSVDFFLIYGFGKIPALGADGSAYSTVVVELIALIWCIILSYQKEAIHPDGKSLTYFNLSLEKDLIKVTLPMLASALSWGLSMSVHSSIIGHQGTDLTAAYSVTSVALELIQCLGHGFASGCGILIGELLGGNELDKAKIYGHQSWKVALGVGFANIVLLAIVGPLVYFFYVLEPQAKTYLIYMLLYNVIYMFACSFNTIFTCGVFPAGGDAIYDAISVFISTWVLAIPITLVGWKVFNWPPMVIYMVMCADEICKFPFLIPRYKKYIWLKNLTHEQQ